MKRFLTLTLILLMMSVSTSYSAGIREVGVAIPRFKVTINKELINNIENKYPFILYKNITYVPLTWDYSNSLSLSTVWDGSGLNIDKKENFFTAVNQDLSGKNSLTKKYTAAIPDYEIVVNGKTINNSSEEYPILNFRNVTYFPLTWRFAVEEFGLLYHWSPEAGLTLATEPSLFRIFSGYSSIEDYMGKWESPDGVFTLRVNQTIQSPTQVEMWIDKGLKSLKLRANLSTKTKEGYSGYSTSTEGDIIFAEVEFKNGEISYTPYKSNMSWAFEELVVPVVFNKHISYKH